MRSLKDYLLLALKGAGMGAADVVPGVSGGTIAFISGIYEELIQTISEIRIDKLRILFKQGFLPFWKSVNGNFLAVLLAGIFLSIVTLAKVISMLLEEHPVLVWSFFFGLVAASIPLVARRVKKWNGLNWFAFGVGAIGAFLVTQLPAVENPAAHWYLFISGAIAICAMILPGISGSFILLLLGSYVTVLDAVNDRNILSIGIFAAGCAIGLLSFSRLLKWMFSRFHDLTVALLSGFLLGSLNKIWPWKHAISTFVKYEGTEKEKVVVLADENLMPWNYEAITSQPPQVYFAIALALGGMMLIFAVDRLAEQKP